MRVFLSSTFVDLIEHRKLAAEALGRLELDVGRMEVFGARPEEPLEACLNEVESCELFLGLYAYRYGNIPEGSDISITELELRHAQLHGKLIFCFVIDEDYPWPPKFIDYEPGRTKLKTLKAMISKDFIIERFRTPDDLAFKIAASVGRYIANITNKLQTDPKSRNPFFQKLRTSGSLLELLEQGLREFERITLTEYNQIFLVCSSAYANHLVAVVDAIPPHKKRYRIPVLFGLLGLAFSSGRVINARDVRDWPEYIEAVCETKSELVVPIKNKASILGVLNSESENLNHFDDIKCNSAELIADALAILLPEFGWTKDRKVKEAPWIKLNPNK